MIWCRKKIIITKCLLQFEQVFLLLFILKLKWQISNILISLCFPLSTCNTSLKSINRIKDPLEIVKIKCDLLPKKSKNHLRDTNLFPLFAIIWNSHVQLFLIDFSVFAILRLLFCIDTIRISFIFVNTPQFLYLRGK